MPLGGCANACVIFFGSLYKGRLQAVGNWDCENLRSLAVPLGGWRHFSCGLCYRGGCKWLETEMKSSHLGGVFFWGVVEISSVPWWFALRLTGQKRGSCKIICISDGDQFFWYRVLLDCFAQFPLCWAVWMIPGCSKQEWCLAESVHSGWKHRRENKEGSNLKHGRKQGNNEESEEGSKEESKKGGQEASKIGSKDGSKEARKQGEKQERKEGSKQTRKDTSKKARKQGRKEEDINLDLARASPGPRPRPTTYILIAWNARTETRKNLAPESKNTLELSLQQNTLQKTRFKKNAVCKMQCSTKILRIENPNRANRIGTAILLPAIGTNKKTKIGMTNPLGCMQLQVVGNWDCANLRSLALPLDGCRKRLREFLLGSLCHRAVAANACVIFFWARCDCANLHSNLLPWRREKGKEKGVHARGACSTAWLLEGERAGLLTHTWILTVGYLHLLTCTCVLTLILALANLHLDTCTCSLTLGYLQLDTC